MQQRQAAPGSAPRRSGLSLQQREAIWAYALLAIPLIFYATVRFWPAIQSLRLSMFTWHVNPEMRRFIGFDYYRELLSNPTFHQALKNTLMYTVITVPASIVLGLAIALLLQAIGRGRGLFRAIYFAPYITPAVAIAWVWGWMYNQRGVINVLLVRWSEFVDSIGLGFLALAPQNWLRNPELALGAVAVVVVWQQLGFQIVIFMAGLQGIPRIYYEAARIDGANRWQIFWNVTIPLLNATMVFAIVITTINALQLFDQIVNISFTDPGGPLDRTLSLALYMYEEAFQRHRLGYAAAVTVVMFAIILIVTLIQLRLTQRRVEYG